MTPQERRHILEHEPQKCCRYCTRFEITDSRHGLARCSKDPKIEYARTYWVCQYFEREPGTDDDLGA